MKVSKLLPHYNLLTALNVEPDMNYLSYFNDLRARSIYRYSPLAILALRKMLSRYSIEEINNRLLKAESKSVSDDFKSWHPMEVWMNFYNIHDAANIIEDIKSKNDEAYSYPKSFPDVLHYSYLTHNDDALDGSYIPRLNIAETGLNTVFPENDFDDKSLVELYPFFNKHVNPAEFIFVAYINHSTGNSLLKKELTPDNVAYNGIVYLIIMTLFELLDNEIQGIPSSNSTNSKISSLLSDFSNGLIPAAINNVVNVKKVVYLDRTNKDLIGSMDDIISRMQALFQSGVPCEKWDDMLDLPTPWISSFSDK